MNGEHGRAPVKPGDVLAGKYRVDRVLGVGGMGVVVAATHMALDEKVALKFLLPEISRDGETVARFVREARASVKIRSEHVVRVSDVGVLDTGAPYIVMEYLEGTDLAARVRQGGPLPIQHAVDAVLQACEALAEAHVLGIVHRDLKPANLFLTWRADGSPLVKILDFGISKMANADGLTSGLTKTTGMMGSPLYMSPEQLQSAKDVDLRTDVWALGVVLFELLSGTQPFIAETMPQLVVQIMGSPPRPLRELRPDVPPGIVAAIDQALQKDRAARTSDVGAFAAAIAPYGGPRAADAVQRVARVYEARGMRISVSTPMPMAAPSSPQMTTGGSGAIAADATSDGALPSKRASKMPFVIAGAVLVLAAIGGVVKLASRSSAAAASSAVEASSSNASEHASEAPAATHSTESPPAASTSAVATASPSTSAPSVASARGARPTASPMPPSKIAPAAVAPVATMAPAKTASPPPKSTTPPVAKPGDVVIE